MTRPQCESPVRLAADSAPTAHASATPSRRPPPGRSISIATDVKSPLNHRHPLRPQDGAAPALGQSPPALVQRGSPAPVSPSASSTWANGARPWSPTHTRNLGRAAAYAAQSIVDVVARSLSPTLQASTLFESPTVMSPTQMTPFHELIDGGSRTESPEAFLHAKQRATVSKRTRRRNTPDLQPRTQPERMHSVDSEHAAVRMISSRAQTPAEEYIARHPLAARPIQPPSEHTISMHSAPRRRVAACAPCPAPRRPRWSRERLLSAMHQFGATLQLLVHPRELAACVWRRGAAQARYWDEAFREPDTGARCWHPPWLHAYIPLMIWLGVTLASTAIVVVFHSAVFGMLDALSVALRRRGVVGRVLFGVMIFVTTFPPFPLYSTLVVLSGFAFGMWQGFMVSYVAALLGALTVFSLSRSFLHGWMTRLLRASGGLSKVVRAIEKQPRLLFLVRLAPYPYNLLNTLLASSTVLTLRTYMLCTACALPKLMVHTALGASIKSFAQYHAPASSGNMGVLVAETHEPEKERAETVRQVASFVGIALCIGIFFYIYHVTSRAVDDLEDKSEGEAAAELDELLGTSEELESDKDEAPYSPSQATPIEPTWVHPALQRRRSTPLFAPESAEAKDVLYAPSVYAPSELGRSASLHQARRPLSIAEQIDEMERAAEAHGSR
ncbi:uncharacterized protein MJAP1_002874 [Malassezia japonica]|uniref:Golgi apparatus membrane protein TVP38 n=1 Tax=Malassezia japonica TaxID=223818 RepID=A0AAF0F7V6_9BASI|nr:uncharacterized protein MJAP1_002874 [Malassezia japonica]WFD39892.1 hypothetical protein MJAP1_002874 [Malassezia japonica]